MQDGAVRRMGSGCQATFTGEGEGRQRGGQHQVEEGKTSCRMCGEDVPEAAATKAESAVVLLHTDVAGENLLTRKGAFVPINVIRSGAELDYYVEGLLAKSTDVKDALEWTARHAATGLYVLPVNSRLIRALVTARGLNQESKRNQ